VDVNIYRKCVRNLRVYFDLATVLSLQLSSFVDYTWQCMKLPPSLLAVDDQSEEPGEHHQQHTALLSPIMAAADSTTQMQGM
jgi:hypothetical protein